MKENKRAQDENGLWYEQTKYGKIYDTIPKEKVIDGFHSYTNKQDL